MAFKITDEDIKRAFSDEPAKKTNGFKVTDADIAKHFKQSDTKAAGAQAPAVSLDNDIKPTYKAPQQETVKLPSYIENQGLYFEPGTKSRIGYLIDSSAKGLVGGALQAGEAIWQDLSGESGKAERAYYDYVMESAYNPEKSGQLAEYQSAKDQAAKNEKLKTDTLGYRLLESSDEDMVKATEDMGATGQFLTGVVGSTLQNAYLAPVALINPALAAGLMSLSAAGRTTKEKADKGKNLDKALARGAIDGSIEYFTEKIGMDAIADLLAGQGDNIVKNVLRSVYSEAGEEGMSYLAGYVADKLSKEPDAKFSIQELALNMLAGGLSGAMLGGGSAMVGAMANTLATPEAVTELPAPENITPANVPASTEFVRANSQENNIDTKPVELPNPVNSNNTPTSDNIYGISAEDEIRYMQTGKKLSTKNAKAKMVESGESPFIRTKQEFKSFLNKVLYTDVKNETKTYGIATKRLRDAVYEKSGGRIDISGMFMELLSDDIRHSYKNHIKAKEKGNIDLSLKDFENIPEYIANFDDIIYAEKTGQGIRIQIGKKINGYSVITEIVSNERNAVKFRNMWGVSTESYERRYKNRGHANKANTQKVSSAQSGAHLYSNNSIPQTKQNMQEAATENQQIAKDINVPGADNNVGSKLPESVGAAKANPKNITHLVNEYGEIKPGENPARFVSAPISTDGTDRVGKFARTAMEAEVTSDKMVAAIEKAVARGEFSHEIYRDKTAIKDATEYIEKYGYEKTLQEFYNRVNNNSGITKQDMTKAMTMYAVAVENDDIKTALKLATKINKAAVNAGQVVQSVRILKKSSPENRLYYAQKSLEAYQDEVNEKYGDKAPVLKVDDSILTALKDARTEAEIEQATADLHQAIADQLPFSWSNFWTSWRYLAMLGNPRTQVRNVLSNAVNTVATEYTAWIQSTIEKNVKGLPKTTTMEKPTRAQVAFAEKDYENIKKQLSGGGKYQKDSLSAIERLKDPFSFPTFWGKQGDEYVGWRGNVRKAGEPILKGISKWNELTNKAMENGDLAFSSRAYKRALARYLKANNINPAKITAKQLSEARTWATRQALESVFRENNRLASWMSMQERNLANSKKKGDRIAAKIIGGIMPFKGTPLNISKRAFEYTPLGVIKGLTEMKFNNDVYMPAAINDVAKGLSGTSLIVLGAALAKYGLLKGGLGNDKEDKMEKQMGEQAYSISTPWWSYTLDWSGAAMMPLFVGADIYESNSEDENWLTNIINAFANAGSPIIETSMMTGLMDSIQAASYEDKDTEKVMTFLSSAMASYVGQFVPTIFGQVARAVDDTSRSSYTNVKGVLKPMAKTLQKAENKIPFLSKTNVPYMDVWGNDEKNVGGNPLSRLAYNMLSPGYISTKSNDKVEKMLVDLHEKTGDNSVLPSNYTTYKRIGDETIRFTDKQYEQYTKEYGQTAYSILDDLQSDKGFSSMEDAYRAEIVGKVYKYSTAIASNEVVNKELTARQANQQTAMEKGISAYYVFGGLIEADENSNGSLSKAEVVDYIESRSGLSNTQKAYLFAALANSNWKNPYA